MGSWIGGDRDGNPFVTADVMRGTLRLQSSRVMQFYLDELHELGAELSIAAHLADVSEELSTLAERSPDTSPHRRDEPYRLAISGIYARLAATAQSSRSRSARGRSARRAPYASVGELQGRSRRAASLADRQQRRASSPRGRLRLLRRAVDCFGFHLAQLDLRQNSAVHERTVAELLDAADPGMSYLALGEEARIALLTANCARRVRCLAVPPVQRRDDGELDVFHAAAEAHATLRPDADPQRIISMCKGMSDMLEVAVLLKEVGLVHPAGRSAHQHRAAVRDHRGSAALRRRHGPHARRCTITAGSSTAAAACRR